MNNYKEGVLMKIIIMTLFVLEIKSLSICAQDTAGIKDDTSNRVNSYIVTPNAKLLQFDR